MRAKKMKVIGRIVLFITAICMLAILFTSLDVAEITADAASLPHIEEILASNEIFNVLEIVPDAAAASFGYYVDGQEPIAGWKDQLATIDSPAERTTYVNDLFSRLVTAGVMSDSTATALKYTYGSAGSYYSEQYEVTDPENWNTIPLSHSETAVVTGVFTETADGAYTADYDYIDKDMGGYIQNIDHFEYEAVPSYGSGTYYYNPTFIPIVIEGENATNLDQLMTNLGDLAVYTKDEAVGTYTYSNKISDGLDMTKVYYYVDISGTGAPGVAGNGCYYAAVTKETDDGYGPGDGFVATAGASYFSRVIISYTYVGTGGKYSFSPAGTETHDVYYNNIYYKAAYTNNNWFKSYVFGLDGNDFDRLDVSVTVRKANEVTLSDVTNADMVYLSAGSNVTNDGAVTAYTAENDLADNEGQALTIYQCAAGDGETPVIVDYSIIQGITSSTPAAEIGMMEKLSLLCLQSELPVTNETRLSALTIDWLKLSYISNDKDKSFVNNNVFCFDAMNSLSTSEAPDINYLVSPNFDKAFDIQVYSDGFTAVLNEIASENLLKQIANEPLLEEDVTLAAAVRHIINFYGRRQTVQKDHIKVLDLEPARVTASTWLTPQTVEGWINKSITAANIEIVHMTTGEFIGKIEDINETYDMVYIGMSTENMYTAMDVNDEGIEELVTVHNDSSMNGMIYTNIGDIYYGSIELAGIRSQDYVDQNGIKAINGMTTNTNCFRFSGNDITEKKVNELNKFVEAGYPLILADDFVKVDGTVNGYYVDNSSYMYAAVSDVYSAPNVLTQNSQDFNAKLIKYLNISKPKIEIGTQVDQNGHTVPAMPVEYVEDGPTLAIKNNLYYLEYQFTIHNVTDATPVSTTYDCNLYVDLNADGRYIAAEELDDIEIKTTDGVLLNRELNAAGNRVFTLYADVEYIVTRAMAKDYVGIIPWKLEVVKNGADHIHASAQGYTRIAATTKTKLRILQIMKNDTINPPNSADKLLNLQDQLTTGSVQNPQLWCKNDNQYYKGIYGKLIKDLDDFDVTITSIEADNLENDIGTTQKIYNLFTTGDADGIGTDGYDMLIIGFADMFGEMGPEGAAAVNKWIGDGRSVLFTHDTTSATNTVSGTQLATGGKLPATANLTDTEIVYDPSTYVYKSADGNISWYDPDYSTVLPPNVAEHASTSNPVYVVFVKVINSYEKENEYYKQKLAVYKMTGKGTNYSLVTAHTSTYEEFRANYGNGEVVYVYCRNVTGWYGNKGYGYDYTNNGSITATSYFTRFIGETKYICLGISSSQGPLGIAYQYTNGTKPNRDYRTDITSYPPGTFNTALHSWIIRSIINGTTSSYSVVGTYDATAKTYNIKGQVRYPATGTPFLQRTLYVSDPAKMIYTLGALPTNITDWGYYFNTIIRDAVGLDRYGVTNGTLRSTVESLGPMAPGTAFDDAKKYIEQNNRGVAYTPGSSRTVAEDECQGYTNYALIRFSGSGNNFKYTKSAYLETDRVTSTVSQVNQGQITSYPYDVNTAAFGGTDPMILASKNNYMSIGETHEQYYQINMNTDDIVAWYCLSGGLKGSSYYDDVPNDVVNAYYIYNKGNVTYSGVGHKSSYTLYSGSSIGQAYINEAKLFVNTMIAAYQATSKKPAISILKSADGTKETSVIYVTADSVDPDSADPNQLILESELTWDDEARAIYFKFTNTNVDQSRQITASFYVSDPNGVFLNKEDEDEPEKKVTLFETTTFYTDDAPVVKKPEEEKVLYQGGIVYKFYLPDGILTLLDDPDKASITICISATASGVDSTAYKWIEIKKVELFNLS